MTASSSALNAWVDANGDEVEAGTQEVPQPFEVGVHRWVGVATLDTGQRAIAREQKRTYPLEQLKDPPTALTLPWRVLLATVGTASLTGRLFRPIAHVGLAFIPKERGL